MGWFDKKNDNRDHISEVIERHHEQVKNNYHRREVIKANQERRRKGLPELPVPLGDWR